VFTVEILAFLRRGGRIGRVLPAIREYLEARSDPALPLRVALGHARASHARHPPTRSSEIGPRVGHPRRPGTFAFFHDPMDDDAG